MPRGPVLPLQPHLRGHDLPRRPYEPLEAAMIAAPIFAHPIALLEALAPSKGGYRANPVKRCPPILGAVFPEARPARWVPRPVKVPGPWAKAAGAAAMLALILLAGAPTGSPGGGRPVPQLHGQMPA